MDVLFVVDVKVNLAAILWFVSLLNYVCFVLLTNINFQGAAKLIQERIGIAWACEGTGDCCSFDRPEWNTSGRTNHWNAVASKVVIYHHSRHGGGPCSLPCRQGNFSAVAALPDARKLMRQSWCGTARGQSLQHGVTLTSPQQDAASQMHCAGCQQASRQTLFLFSVLSFCPPASNSVWCVGCGGQGCGDLESLLLRCLFVCSSSPDEPPDFSMTV